MLTTELPNCLVCDSANLEKVIDLGEQPLANTLLDNPNDPYVRYPLILNRCKQCGHGQLAHSVSPDILYSNYAYASGTSNTLRAYFKWFAEECANILRPQASVLEIACNDGSLLHQFDNLGFFTYGVDPAENITDKVTGLRITTDMWPCEVPYAPHGGFDLIVAMNVLAHGPTPVEFMKGIRKALAPAGVAIIQTSQGDMLRNGEFDNIYHEHHSYFAVSSMAWLAARAGLRLNVVRGTSVHGGSLCWVLSHADSESMGNMDGFLASAPFRTDNEIPKLGSAEGYFLFADKVRRKIEYIKYAIERHAGKRKVVFVGYAAKAAVVLHATDVTPDYIFDEAELKLGKWVPGLNVQISPLGGIGKVEEDLLIVIGAWNYKDELTKKIKALRSNGGDRYLVYMPDIEEY